MNIGDLNDIAGAREHKEMRPEGGVEVKLKKMREGPAAVLPTPLENEPWLAINVGNRHASPLIARATVHQRRSRVNI